MTVFTATHLSKSFGMNAAKQTVLEDASLSVSAGEFVTIVGPSGSGKSTLLNLCGLIDRPDSGELFFQGQAVHEFSFKQAAYFRREYLGFIFQSFNLIPVMSVFDNVAYPLMLLNINRATVIERVMRVLQQVGIDSLADKKPGQLSGGQCQRVAIARALVKQPAVIIADEPTASLDAESALGVIELMKTLAKSQGTACLIATHDQRVLPFSDRVLHVEQGCLIEDDCLTSEITKGAAA